MASVLRFKLSTATRPAGRLGIRRTESDLDRTVRLTHSRDVPALNAAIARELSKARAVIAELAKDERLHARGYAAKKLNGRLSRAYHKEERLLEALQTLNPIHT